MKVGYVQFAPELKNPAANLDKMRALTRGVRADLLVFPELATTGYALGDRQTALDMAHTLDSKVIGVLRSMAATTGGLLCVGIAEQFGSKVFNSSVLVGRNGVLQIYRKSHLFWNETDLFDVGNTGFQVVQTPSARVGTMVCFDWAFPESAGTLARRGAQIIAHPSNLVLPYAARAMPVRALENRAFTITANRTGTEPTAEGPLKFNGQSMIASPTGEVLKSAPTTGEHVHIIEIDPTQADNKQITPRNHLMRDRRTELYEG